MKKLLVIIVLVLFVFSGLVLNAEAKKEVKKIVKVKKVKKVSVSDTIVYVKAKGKKYHKKNCKVVKEKKGIKLSEALKKGYTACAMCKPVTKPITKKKLKKVKKLKKLAKKK